MLPWRRIGPGLARTDAEYKLLSRDVADGACTALIRYPRGWRREGPEHIDAGEEFYVLDGAFELNGRRYGADCYACLPAGWPREAMAAPEGAVLLTFYDREPHLRAGRAEHVDEAGAIVFFDAAAEPWDMSLNDPNLKHLGISRKNLRTDQKTGERTFLSLILPQSTPAGGKGKQEIHPCVEEAYVISGSLAGPHGVMHPGAYFWRPAGVAHGPFGARWGCVSLIRFVGGRHVNVWTAEEAPFDIDAPYAPVLPPDLRPYAAAFAPAAPY
jgi:quercetin dioxygenase-like cupin family protein